MGIRINRIYNEACLLTLKKLKSKSIDGIITSPPYNINTERSDMYYNNGYSDIDGLTEIDYLKLRFKEFYQFSRVLKSRGVICYNISYAKENPILPILLLSRIHADTNLTLAGIITWKKPNAIPFQTSPTKLSRITELIYVIVNKNHLHNFKTNKIVSKTNEKISQKFYKNYTNYIEDANNDGYKCKLKASYSQELWRELIKIYFPKGSLIYDSFSGIGTTELACIDQGCNFLGSELDTELYKIGKNRILTKLRERRTATKLKTL